MGQPPQWVHSLGDPLPDAMSLAEATSQLGGKAAGLKRMLLHGLAVPPGFVVTTAACAAYLAANRNWPEGLAEQVQAGLAMLERETVRLGTTPEQQILLAVRSGAAESMPGMLDTLLNRRPDELHEAISQVFDSWPSARAAAYRQQLGLTHLTGTAVIVQAMAPADVSGVLFTQDPLDRDSNQLVIEAVSGLGTGVVSGEITPARYLLDRDAGAAPAPASVTHDPLLSQQQLQELRALGLRMERLFGGPVDIEWCWGAGRCWLLQARPIQDLSAETDRVRRETIAHLKSLAGGRHKLWVAHNLGESLPSPTPLTWDIVSSWMRGGFVRGYQLLGYRPSQRILEQGFLDLIAGRIFADPDRLTELFFGELPLAYDKRALKENPALLEGPPETIDPQQVSVAMLWRWPVVLGSMLRCSRRLRNAETIQMRFDQCVVPRYLAWIEQQQELNVSGQSDGQLHDLLAQRCRMVFDDFAAEMLPVVFLGGWAFKRLEAQLRQIVGPREGAETAGRLTSGLDGNPAVGQELLLYEIAQGRADRQEFLSRYGHRAAGEMELSRPRWQEAPQELDALLASMRESSRDPSTSHRAARDARIAAESRLAELLAAHGGSSMEERVRHDLALAQRLLPYREIGRHHLLRGYALVRAVVEEMARRWKFPDLYFLCRDELRDVSIERDELQLRAVQRKQTWRAARRIALPQVIDSADLDRLGLPVEAKCMQELSGIPLSPGVGSGVIRICRAAQPLDQVDNCVLVCSAADPGLVPLLARAAALVVERGGLLSHGAILARDFGLPAIVCPHAMAELPEGRRARVDGRRGTVSILDGGPSDA